MADKIQLLPDSIANQIAAGEVVQRPSSVVKELLENAIDAKASEIQLIIKNAGKTLVQVVDNGRGMSEMDARMCFERHATSKIRTAEDLFSISTMGFRGEALASIAAVSKVELTTRSEFDEIGTTIKVEGSEVKLQEPCAHAKGTSISVKNLFYNVPARLKFLKSDTTEFKHIMDEFNRVVLAYPTIQFSFYHNNQENYRLVSGNSRQRVVSLFGKLMNERLVPVLEEMDDFKVEGFVTKPSGAKKAREQFIFVNSRFIKSPYLNHAIRSAYEEMIPKDMHPPFFLFLTVNPSKVDVNVHPTKQEVKFEDERLVYNYVKVAVRHALGKYSITPSLDFDVSNELMHKQQGQSGGGFSGSRPGLDPLQKQNLKHWDKIYEGMITIEPEEDQSQVTIPSQMDMGVTDEENLFGHDQFSSVPYQIHKSFIIYPIKSGFLLIDQQAASERVFYEHVLGNLRNSVRSSQKRLFPETIELSNTQFEVFNQMQEYLFGLGFEIEPFGDQTAILHAVPSILTDNIDIVPFIFDMIDDFANERETNFGAEEIISKTLAKNIAVKKGKSLTVEEMQDLVDKLFACEMPFKTPTGKNCFISMELDELMRRFNR